MLLEMAALSLFMALFANDCRETYEEAHRHATQSLTADNSASPQYKVVEGQPAVVPATLYSQ